jgi:putative transposase
MGIGRLSAGQDVRIGGDEFTMLRSIGDTCWQVEQRSTKRIKEFERSEIRRLISAGEFVFCASAQVKSIGKLQIQLPEGASAEIKMRRTYVKEFMEAHTRAAQNSAIRRVHEKLNSPSAPPSHSTVFRWARTLREAGGDARALAKMHHKKGNRDERFKAEVIEICEKAIKAVYMRRERGTIADVYERASTDITNENKLLLPGCQLPKPSRKLIRKLINRIDAFDRHAARHGRDAAIRHFRSVLGHVIAEAPLERVEFDTTRLDVFVTRDEDGIPLGRPWITIAIDVYTRSILGVTIEFVPPSYITVAKTLKHAFLPKIDLHKQFPEIKKEWIQHGVMRTLILDNAFENHMDSLDDVCLALNIVPQYAPRKTGWFKPHVERVIRTVNAKIPHKISGTTYSNIIEKGDYDPEKHALVSFSALKSGLIRWIVDVYHQRTHRSLETTPAIMWRTSISEDDIPLPDESVNLDVLMGRKHSRRLTHRGIDFECLQYNSPELAALRRKLGSELDVIIKVDEEDLGHIHVISPTGDVAYKVPSLRQDYAADLTLFQHDVFRKYRREKLSTLNDDPDGWMLAKQEILERLEMEGYATKRRRATHKRLARFEAGKKKKTTAVAASAVVDDVRTFEPNTDFKAEFDHPTDRDAKTRPLKYQPDMRHPNARID